jgi:hypothetical protein
LEIFISNSSKNNNIVEKIMNIFKIYYIDYWADLEQIENPDNVIGKINKGLKNIHIFSLFDRKIHESEWVQKETNAVTSFDHSKRIKKF